MSNSDVWGFLPCGGRGERLGLPVIKELLPVALRGGRLVPMIESSWRQIRAEGIRKMVVPVAPDKVRLFQYLRERDNDADVYTFFQSVAHGTGHVLALAEEFGYRRWLAYAMPDTLIFPSPWGELLAARDVHAEVDAVFALYPTKTPGDAGMFELDEENRAERFPRVVAHEEKNPHSSMRLMWGAALLAPRMGVLAGEMWRWGLWQKWARRRADVSGRLGMEFTVDDVWDEALVRGYVLRGAVFPGGRYRDLGTPDRYWEAVREAAL